MFEIITQSTLLPYILGILAGANVLLGGYLVLKLKKHFNTFLGFAGGVMLSIVSFEVIPEMLELSHELELPLFYASFAMVFGFLLFHVISFFFPLHEHGHHTEETDGHVHAHSHKAHHTTLGIYGAVLMIVHSFIDGFGIGLGLQISGSLGIAIAVAVMTHNFSDGINTVSTLLNAKTSIKKLKLLLTLNITAPLLGILLSNFVTLPKTATLGYLGFFAGSILYLAISDILPQAHSNKSHKAPIIATVLGVIFVIAITLLTGHDH